MIIRDKSYIWRIPLRKWLRARQTGEIYNDGNDDDNQYEIIIRINKQEQTQALPGEGVHRRAETAFLCDYKK